MKILRRRFTLLPTLAVSICAAVAFTVSFSFAQQQPPPPRFVLAEAESGEGNITPQTEPGASGGRRIAGFGKGKSVSVEMNVTELMPEATLYVRYARAAPGDGSLAVMLAPVSALDDGTPAVRGPEFVTLPSTGSAQSYRWAAVSEGKIEPGRWRVTLVNSDEGEAGELDALVLANDASGGTSWQPPNIVKDGKLTEAAAAAADSHPLLEIVRVTGPTGETRSGSAPHLARFVAVVRNRSVDTGGTVIMIGELLRGDGQRLAPVAASASVRGARLVLAPGATGGAPLTVTVPQDGDYILVVTATANGAALTEPSSAAAVSKTAFSLRGMAAAGKGARR